MELVWARVREGKFGRIPTETTPEGEVVVGTRPIETYYKKNAKEEGKLRRSGGTEGGGASRRGGIQKPKRKGEKVC